MLSKLATRSGLLKNLCFPKSYLLKNGRVVNADISEHKDVLIDQEKIVEVASSIPAPRDAEVIDCSNRLIIPGGIDTHTHMQLPFMGTNAMDDFDSGSKAALAGGTTSFIDFVIPNKGERLTEAYQRWRDWADSKVNSDYALHCAITEWNEHTEADMRKMVEQGITSFKFFMAYNNILRIQDNDLYKAFSVAKELGAICLVHAENGDLIEINQNKLIQAGVTGPEGHYLSRPEDLEAEAVHRVITIAEQAQCPIYIVHVMSKLASEEVQRAKARGKLVYSETLAAPLALDGKKLWDKDWDTASRYVMSPPLNPDPSTPTHLMKMIQANVIDVVGTDNCTFCTDQKRMGKDDFRKIPNGLNGLEDRLSVVWTKGVRSGLISQNQFVEATSTRAAQIFNMYPKKGVIRAGADADVVVWDAEHEHTISKHTHHHKIDYNVFEGLKVFGKAQYTFSRGNLVWNGSEFMNQGRGHYVKRSPFGYPFARHKFWTAANNPLNQKVDRQSKDERVTTQSDELKLQLETLSQELRKVTEQRDILKKAANNPKSESALYGREGEFNGIEPALAAYLPPKVHESVRKILYGAKTPEQAISKKTQQFADNNDFQIKKYTIPALSEQTRAPRIVKIAAIQNRIVKPTTDPVAVQKKAIIDRISLMIQAAAMEKANVVCLQEIWNAPFFMCTRERYPWVEFSEPVDGQSTQALAQLAKKHNMVIISSILEREPVRGTLHNTAVVIDNHGDVLGTQVKGHIPRVGDFNESTYYLEGLSGHPVFNTDFGKIGINICYGRHHPLNWMAFGLNGAEMVFNPSATVGGLSEPLWSIQARNAAIANHYFAIGINRIGTQHYPNAFTSGDGKEAHKDFGHFYGSSYVAAPDGSRTPSLPRNRDGVLITELDLNMCQQVKDKWGFTMTARFEDYAKLLTEFTTPGYKPQVIEKKKK